MCPSPFPSLRACRFTATISEFSRVNRSAVFGYAHMQQFSSPCSRVSSPGTLLLHQTSASSGAGHFGGVSGGAPCTSPFPFIPSVAHRTLFRDLPKPQASNWSSTTPAFPSVGLDKGESAQIELVSSVLRTGEGRCACCSSGCVKRACWRVRTPAVSADGVDSL